MSVVDELMEEYRVRLGLLPWAEHRRRALDQSILVVGHGMERRTGRTTRGLLACIATCVVDKHDTLYVYARPQANAVYCVNLARDMIAKLGLTLRVRQSPENDTGWRSLHIEYVDHYRGER